jgi:hypothetical protein
LVLPAIAIPPRRSTAEMTYAATAGRFHAPLLKKLTDDRAIFPRISRKMLFSVRVSG